MAENVTEVILQGVDQLTPVANKAVANLTTSLNQVKAQSLSVSSAFSKLNTSISSFTSQLRSLAFSGIALTAGIFGTLKSFSSLGVEVNRASQRVGLSVDDFQKFDYAARESGVSTEEFTNSLYFLNRAKALALRDPASVQAMAFLGAKMDENYLKTHNQREIILKLSDAFKNSTNTANKAAIATYLLGRSSGNVFTFFNKGSKDILAAGDEAERYGNILRGPALAATLSMDHSLFKLWETVKGIRNSFALALIPIMQPLIDRWSEWYSQNKDLVQLKISDFIKEASHQLLNLWNVMKGIGLTVWPVISGLGGLKTLLIGYIGLKLAGLAIGLTQIGSALYFMGGALLANPITLTIAALAALGIAVYLVYKNWDTLKAKFLEIWPDMKNAFINFADWMTNNNFSMVMNMLPEWEVLKLGFTAAFMIMRQKFDSFFNYLLPQNSMLVTSLEFAWDKFKDHYTKILKDLILEFARFIDVITFSTENGLVNRIEGITPINAKKTIAGEAADKLGTYAKIAALFNPVEGPFTKMGTIRSLLSGLPMQPPREIPVTPPDRGAVSFAQQQNIKLNMSLKIDSEGRVRARDIKPDSNIPMDLDVNTGVIR